MADMNTNNSASKLKIIAQNVRSIGKEQKRVDVLQALKKGPRSKIAKSIESAIRQEWEGEVFFSSFSSQARGVAIYQ